MTKPKKIIFIIAAFLIGMLLAIGVLFLLDKNSPPSSSVSAQTYVERARQHLEEGNNDTAISDFKKAQDVYTVEGNTQQAEAITQEIEAIKSLPNTSGTPQEAPTQPFQN